MIDPYTGLPPCPAHLIDVAALVLRKKIDNQHMKYQEVIAAVANDAREKPELLDGFDGNAYRIAIALHEKKLDGMSAEEKSKLFGLNEYKYKMLTMGR